MKCLITTLKESVTIENPVFFDSVEVYVNPESGPSEMLVYIVEYGKTVDVKDKDGTVVETLKGNGSEE